MGRCCQAAKVQRDPAHIVFSIYISVFVSRHVPLPVCSGVDLCALSLWLKPYPCNRPLRVGVTCGRSRFRLCTPCLSAAHREKGPSTTSRIGFLLECLTLSSRFLLLARRGSLSEVRHRLHSYPGCSLFNQTANFCTESGSNMQNGDVGASFFWALFPAECDGCYLWRSISSAASRRLTPLIDTFLALTLNNHFFSEIFPFGPLFPLHL